MAQVIANKESVMSEIAKYVLAAAAALLLTAWQAAAVGASLDGGGNRTPSIAVKYSDLDLNRPSDVRVLYRRIRFASEESCGLSEITGSHQQLPSWKRCVAGAIDRAVAQVDRPALTAYHRQHAADAASKG
jgi:UrcA family protein